MEYLLKNIPEKIKKQCIVKNGVIYCPEMDHKGNIIRTAQDIIEGINKITPKPSAQDILNAKLIEENKKQKIINADLILKITMMLEKSNT